MRSVRFRRGYGPYNAREVAGFKDEEAARLVGARVADYADAPAEAVVDAPAPTQAVAPPVAAVADALAPRRGRRPRA